MPRGFNAPCDDAPTPKPFIIPNFGGAEGQESRYRDIGNPAPAATGKGGGPRLPRNGPDLLLGQGQPCSSGQHHQKQAPTTKTSASS